MYNFKESGNHKFKGERIIRASDLKKPGNAFEMWNRHKEKSAGQIRVESFHSKIQHTFLDYIRGGLNLSVITCIDFTGSNGIPTSPQSLHYRSGATLNQYQKAITSVCSILLNYDYDKQIQVFGFGGKPNFTDVHGNRLFNGTSHFFPCSGDMSNTSGLGVEGVFQLYNKAISNVELSGPTYFAPLLENVTNFTELNAQKTLIITQFCLFSQME